MYKRGTLLFRQLLNPLDRLFDRLYGSKYNPLYQSGALAVCLLAIAVATGCYLLFWYSLSSPYESMKEIESQVFLARWVRTLHRYASDLSVVVVVFHVFRMITEGKSWGPRVLAWVTGVVLALGLFIISWTGFILVWDRQAQALAVAGAQIAGVLPFFESVLKRAVSGATPVGTSFFFMNLFVHMSLPLGMVFLLWLHTSKLKKPAWFPSRRVFLGFTALLILFSVVWPAPLAAPADLLQLSEEFKLNVFFAFVIPLARYFTPLGSFLLMSGIFIIMLFVPKFWRPREENKPKASAHNQLACTGCGQCALDCPFDAIDLVARTAGEGSEKVAFVDSSACVSCGICTASCSQMAIGPEDKSSRLQMQIIKDLKARHPQGSTLFIHCQRNPLGEKFLRQNPDAYAAYPIDCTGNLHVAATSFALNHFGKVEVVGCPAHACVNRLGQERLEQRFLQGRPPEAPARMDFSKVRIFSGSLIDFDRLKEKMAGRQLSENLWWPRFKMLLSTLSLLAVTAAFSAIPYENLTESSMLRVAIRLPGQAAEICRERSPEEMAALPQHMRNARECKRQGLDYSLEVTIDENKIVSEKLSAAGVRGDKPILFDTDIPLAEGLHQVTLELLPLNEGENQAVQGKLTFTEEFRPGRAILVYYDSNSKTLVHSDKAVK